MKKNEPWDKSQRFSLRKLTVGTCSVLLGFVFLGTNTVQAEEGVVNADENITVIPEEPPIVSEEPPVSSEEFPVASEEPPVASEEPQNENTVVTNIVDTPSTNDVSHTANDVQPTMEESTVADNNNDESDKVTVETSNQNTDTLPDKFRSATVDESTTATESNNDTRPEREQVVTRITVDEKKRVNSEEEVEPNKFNFFTDNWVVEGNEAYITVPKNTTNIENIKYDIPFLGNGIDLYAIKSHNHGIVDIFLNNEKVETVDLYAASRQQAAVIYSVKNLLEGNHLLSVRSTGRNNGSVRGTNYVNQVVRAEVHHLSYEAESIDFENKEIALNVGQTIDLKPIVTPTVIANPNIVYTTSDNSVLEISATGTARAIAKGQATVIASLDNISTSIIFNVDEAIAKYHGTFVDNNLHYTKEQYQDVFSQDVKENALTLWKNDRINTQIAILSEESELKNLRFNIGAVTKLDNNNPVDGIVVTGNFIQELSGYRGNAGYHNASKLNIPTTPSISRPDLLVRENTVNVAYNDIQNIWFDIKVPENVEAGHYTTQITVQADGIDEPMVFELNFEVLDASLNGLNAFDIELWQYPYRIAEYYGVEPFSDKHLEILKTHLLKYKEIGGNGITASIVEEAWGGQTYAESTVRVPSMIKWFKELDGTYSFNYDDFDKWVTLADEIGMSDKIIGYSMIPWGNNISYFNKATNQQETINLPVTHAQYSVVWTQFLTDLTHHLDSKDWFDKFYMGIDERPNMDMAFDVIDKVKNKEGKKIKIAAAANHFSGSFARTASRIDHLSIGTPHMKSEMDAFRKFVADRTAKGQKTTLYTATEEYLNNLLFNIPGESYFTVLYGAKFNTNGFLRWALDAWVKDPLNDLSHWAFEAGDTQLLYPDKPDAENPESQSSVRFEKMAQAVRDINKLYQIKEEVPALESKVNTLLNGLNDYYSRLTRHNGLGRQIAREPNEETISLLKGDLQNFKNTFNEITREYIAYKNNVEPENIALIVDNNEIDLTLSSSSNINARFDHQVRDNRLVFVSSNPEIVSVNEAGQIVGHNVGSVTISVTAVRDPKLTTKVKVVVHTVNLLDEFSDALIYHYQFDGNIENLGTFETTDNHQHEQFGEGIYGQSLIVTPSTVVITDAIDLKTNYTMSFWMKQTDNNGSGISSVFWDGINVANTDKFSTSLDVKVGQGSNSNNMGWHVPEGYLTYQHTAANNGWNHYTVVNNGTQLILYVDGTRQATINWNKPVQLPIKYIGGKNFSGELDELVVFNRVLNDEQIKTLALRPGINLKRSEITVNLGEEAWIGATLNNHKSPLIYEIQNPNFFTVNQDGFIIPKRMGTSNVTIRTEDGLFEKIVSVAVSKHFEPRSQLELIELPKEYIEVLDRVEGEYLGQPDMVLLEDGKTLVTVYPKGHGHGELVLKRSEDGGQTWSERLPINDTWRNSRETPTLYTLNFVNGEQKVIMISGGPKVAGWGDGQGGFYSSISDDKGVTWTDLEGFYKEQPTIVAMASLVQIHENGKPIDKWMGVFHDFNFVNYKTYLTFNEEGQAQWTAPEAYLSKYRTFELDNQMCEIEIFRSPDGSTLVGLARNQRHNNFATMFYSTDEGVTWSKPRHVPASLTGERHKVSIDPVSNRLLITFREIILDWNNNGVIENNDWMAGDWIAWVGTFDDIMEGNDGEYRIRLAEDFTPNTKSGDTGYSGNVVLEDGTFVINSYGVFFEEDARVNPSNTPSNVTWTTSILKARFSLKDLDKIVYPVTDPEETTPGETTPGETTPGETTPGETEPGETEPGETEPGETEPGETTPGETEPGETAPGETTPGETEPGETEPGETAPGETEPGETEPGETEPGETEPGETTPGETEPGETTPGETEPGETEPGETAPGETEPGETEPGETEPGETEPKETESEVTEPEETNPEVTEPKETESEEPGSEQTAPEVVDSEKSNAEDKDLEKSDIDKKHNEETLGVTSNPQGSRGSTIISDNATSVSVALAGQDAKEIKTIDVSKFDIEKIQNLPEILKENDSALFEILTRNEKGEFKQITELTTVYLPKEPDRGVLEVLYILPTTGAIESLPFEVEGNFVKFDVSHFSVYGIVYLNKKQESTIAKNNDHQIQSSLNTVASVTSNTPNTSTNETTNQTRATLPDTGENHHHEIFNAAALSILVGLGLINLPAKKKED